MEENDELGFLRYDRKAKEVEVRGNSIEASLPGREAEFQVRGGNERSEVISKAEILAVTVNAVE